MLLSCFAFQAHKVVKELELNDEIDVLIFQEWPESWRLSWWCVSEYLLTNIIRQHYLVFFFFPWGVFFIKNHESHVVATYLEETLYTRFSFCKIK